MFYDKKKKQTQETTKFLASDYHTMKKFAADRAWLNKEYIRKP